MDKKIIIGLVSIILLGIIMFYTKFPSYFTKPENSSNQISGHITEAGDNFIVVNGVVKSNDPEGKRQEKRTIKFQITSNTVLRKTALVVGVSNLKPNTVGEPFKPDKVEMGGKVGDLIQNTTVSLLKSKENLFTTDNATALEINYFGFEYK